MRAAGVDGCRAGWIALLDPGDGRPLAVRVVASGQAAPHPPEDIRDSLGLRIAIWA
jgi:predicted RNase H-like nuclease